MQTDMLIAEDLVVLILNDENVSITGIGALLCTIGGAMIAELALRGRVEIDEGRVGANGDGARAIDGDPFSDPTLQLAFDSIARRGTEGQTQMVEIGAQLYQPILDRLLGRGLVWRVKNKDLGSFRITTLPIRDGMHGANLVERIRGVLEHGEIPDARMAVFVGLLSASGSLQSLYPPITWSPAAVERALALENGNRIAVAVKAVINRTGP